MSWSDAGSARGRLALLALAAALLSGCTAGPLYGTSGAQASLALGAPRSDLRDLVTVAPPADRTTQLVRDAFLTRYSGDGGSDAAPFELVIRAAGAPGSSIVEPVSGLPTASIYTLTVNWRVLRRADGAEVGNGVQRSQSPYDQSSQLFAADRAVSNARAEAARDAALKLELAVASLLRREAAGL